MGCKCCVVFILFITTTFNGAFGIVYHLNDTEYQRLPALFDLEPYEPCVAEPGAIYCVAHLELYTDSENELYSLIQEYSKFRSKHYNHSQIDRGVCMTKTCQKYNRNGSFFLLKNEIGGILEACLNDTVQERYGLNARVLSMSCDSETDDQNQVDSWDRVVAAIFAILLLAAVAGTYHDINRGNDYNGNRILSCFSVFRNFKKLICFEQPDDDIKTFKGIHGLRTITMFVVIYAHVKLLDASGFTSNPHNFEKQYDSVFHRITLSGLVVVQINFFLSGFFMSYFLQKLRETTDVAWDSLPKAVFLRWWRLTPPAALLIGFMATWMRHVGSGPLWNLHTTHGPTAQCRQYFWYHIFYINNYQPEDKICAFQTWYAACEMQVFIIGLMIHILIKNRSRSTQLSALALCLLASMVAPAAHVWIWDLDALAMIVPELYRSLFDATFRYLHVFGHNNMSCYIMGMANGYLAYHLQKNKILFPNFKLGSLLCWGLVPAVAGVFYCGSLFFAEEERPSLAVRMLFAATHRASIGIIMSVWIMGLVMGFNGFSKALLEWNVWIICSRLSYSVYLIHIVLVHILLAIRPQLTPVSYLSTAFSYVGVVVVSYALALPFYLLVEAPASCLIKALPEIKIKQKET